MKWPSYVRICGGGLLIAAFCIRSVEAQEPSCQHRVVPIALRDAQNLPIQNISPADLEGNLRGKPVKILSIAPDQRDHRLVLILDTSGSMGSTGGETPAWHLEFLLASHFFTTNQQKSQLALLLFNDRVTDVVGFSQGNSAISDKLQHIAADREFTKKNVKGKTALLDAILDGLQLINHPSSGDALYVLTDGGDNASSHRVAEVRQRLAVTSVRLFAILVEANLGNRNRTPEEESGPGELSEIAQNSGGEVLSVAASRGDRVALSANSSAKAKTQETLARLYQTILQDSLLHIELSAPIAKDQRWELKLSKLARQHWKGVRITYPKVLLSCSSEVFGSRR